MKYRFLYILIFGFLFSIVGFAQDKPAWITSIEKTIQQKETEWKIEGKIERGQSGFFSGSFLLKSTKNTALIEITVWGIIDNPEETFDSLVTIFDKSMGKDKKKTKLDNFEGEGFIWTNRTGDGWTTIKFKKKDIFVNVFAPSEKTARRFAQYVIDQMP